MYNNLLNLVNVYAKFLLFTEKNELIWLDLRFENTGWLKKRENLNHGFKTYG